MSRKKNRWEAYGEGDLAETDHTTPSTGYGATRAVEKRKPAYTKVGTRIKPIDFESIDNNVSQRGRASKASQDLKDATNGLLEANGVKVLRVPTGKNQVNFMSAIRQWLSHRGKTATIAKVGDTEICIKLRSEEKA